MEKFSRWFWRQLFGGVARQIPMESRMKNGRPFVLTANILIGRN